MNKEVKVYVRKAIVSSKWTDELEIEDSEEGYFTVSGSMFIASKEDLNEFTEVMENMLRDAGLI